MAARASTRISIRWPPEPASEPTDTLVLSLDGHYVDLRVNKSDNTIDWALAGERILISEEPLKVKFTHPVDSHIVDCTGEEDEEEPEPDIGQFSKLPNGDDLETGQMPCPHLNGKVMPYEEVWRQLDWTTESTIADPISGNAKAWILESNEHGGDHRQESNNIKTFYARLGKLFIAVQRKKPEVSPDTGSAKYTFAAVRQDFDDEAQKWMTKYSIGDVGSIQTMHNEAKKYEESSKWKVGETIIFGGAGKGERCTVKAVSY